MLYNLYRIFCLSMQQLLGLRSLVILSTPLMNIPTKACIIHSYAGF